MGLRRGWLIFSTVLALSVPAFAQDAPRPDYSRFRGGEFLRYLNARDGSIDGSPRIGLSFGGRVLRATLDSGSTGVVVAAALIPGFDRLPVLGEGRLTYTSSGRIMIGSWVKTPLKLVGDNGVSVKTAPMPVLAVTRIECTETARSCTPDNDPRHTVMVGIGFGREAGSESQSTPDKNPLLQVSGEAPRLRGYVLTQEGVYVGLTAADTAGDFRFVQLQRAENAPDWAGVPACISIGGVMPPACGSMLVDTGVDAMFMTVPPSQASSVPLPVGTSIAILLGTGPSDMPLYSFTTGDPAGMAPTQIHLRVSQRRVFVNTGVHFLRGYDVLYDADGGYAAFRRH